MKIIATATNERAAKWLLKGDEQTAKEQAIADDPEAHPVIPRTNGVRKARWMTGQRKSAALHGAPVFEPAFYIRRALKCSRNAANSSAKRSSCCMTCMSG